MLKNNIFAPLLAGVAELVDALDLGSSTVRCGGSTPFIRTNLKPPFGGFKFKISSNIHFLLFVINKCIFATLLKEIR